MSETISRVWCMPHRYTFSMPPVKGLISRYNAEPDHIWVDPFCGQNSPADIRNDADEAIEAESHEDGLHFLRSLEDSSVCGVLFDPPYSTEQALRKYKPIQGGTAGRAEYWAKCKDEIARISCPNGVAICFGWDSTGIGKKRGFKLVEVLLVCHGACHNDTIITVERRGRRER